MDVDDKDEYENENIISYDFGFMHDIEDIYLLLSPISSLIHYICNDVIMIEVDYSLINNDQIKYNIDSIKQNWKLKKWNNVISDYQLILQSTSERNHQIATINYHIASIQNLYSLLIKDNNNNKNPYQIIKNSSHFNKLKLLFESNRDCYGNSDNVTMNQLLKFYSNLIIIQLNTGNYDKANEMISNELFDTRHFHRIFNKYLDLESKTWPKFIKYWMNDNNVKNQTKLLKFLKKYNSIIRLFVLYVCIKLKVDELDNMDNIQWIIQYLENKEELYKFVEPLMDQIYILKSIYLLQDNKYNDSISMLNKCSEQNMPLSVFIKGWINFHIFKDYETSKKYFKLSAQKFSFGESHCINYFAFICWKSNKYQQALKLLQNAIKKSFNNKQIKDICLINWIQLCLVSNNNDNNNIDIERILNTIKPETNKTLSWELSFTKITTEITKYDISRIKSQNYLLNKEYNLSYKGYKKLIGSENNINDEMQIISIYQQFCCSCIGMNRIYDITKLGTKLDRNNFELDIIYIHALIQQKQENIIEIIKRMHNKYNKKDKDIVSWWYSILCATCYEMDGKLELAEKYYDFASDKTDCLLSMYRYVNILRKIGNKEIETAVFWLNFLKISLTESIQFYQDKINDNQEIEKYLLEKINEFKSFGIRHKPSFCKNGMLFGFIFQYFDFYKLDKLKLIEMTKYCLTEWIKILQTNVDRDIIKCFVQF